MDNNEPEFFYANRINPNEISSMMSNRIDPSVRKHTVRELYMPIKYTSGTALGESYLKSSGPNDFASQTFKNSYSPYDLWGGSFFKCIHILCRTYDPNLNYANVGMEGFLKSVAILLPDKNIGREMLNFINMSGDTANQCLSYEEFYNVAPLNNTILQILQTQPSAFLDWALQTSDNMFYWSYLLHIHIKKIRSSPNSYPSFMEVEEMYQINKLDKTTWGNSVWFLIHFLTINAPFNIDQRWANSFKSMMSSFQFILPCGICRKHISENLASNPINRYFSNRDSIFQWGWNLHNIVNKSIGKPEMDLHEAFNIYNSLIINA